MARAVITKHDIELVRRQKQDSFVLPENCIVTVAARDTAKEYAIRLVSKFPRDASSPQTASSSIAPEPSARSYGQSDSLLVETIKKKLMEQVPIDSYPTEIIEEAIMSALRSFAHGETNKGGVPHVTGPATAVPAVAAEGERCLQLSESGVQKKNFSGGFLMNASVGPQEATVLPKDNLFCLNSWPEESTGSPFGVVQCSWGKARFEHVCKEPMLLVVLDGVMTFSTNDTSFSVQAGSALYLEKDTQGLFVTDAAVRCLIIRSAG